MTTDELKSDEIKHLAEFYRKYDKEELLAHVAELEAERLELRKTLGWAYDLDEYKDNPEVQKCTTNSIKLNRSNEGEVIISRVKLEQLAKEAEEAFWGVVAQSVEQAKTGDLDPYLCIAFSDFCCTVIKDWIITNVVDNEDGDYILE